MTPDLFRVPGPWPGTLAITTRPRGGDWLADEAAGWRRAGVDVLVSLLEPDEAAEFGLGDEAEAAGRSGVEFISFPIRDMGVPKSTRAAVSLLREIAAALERGKNVAIHCRQGIGRSGLIAAALLVMSGFDPDASLRAVSAARGRAIPETDAQLEWIRRLPSQSIPASP